MAQQQEFINIPRQISEPQGVKFTKPLLFENPLRRRLGVPGTPSGSKGPPFAAGVPGTSHCFQQSACVLCEAAAFGGIVLLTVGVFWFFCLQSVQVPRHTYSHCKQKT